jgi:LytS/YehU family sensor histidine kinase
MSIRLRNHLLFWAAYVFFKAVLNYSSDTLVTWEVFQTLVLVQVSFLIVKVPLVYGSFYFTDKYLEGRWTRLYMIAALAVAFLVGAYGMFIINSRVVLPLVRQVESPAAGFGIDSLIYYFFTLLFVVGVALAIRLFRKQYQLELHKAQWEKEKTEAELKYLKGQLNPHFLFNTLNNIYSLARKGSEQTAESVMKLATMMRFMLYEASAASIPLKAELKIIEDYIELEKLRYSDRLQVKWMTDIDDPEAPIAPLLLIHFVENAFKHGAGESRTDIDIRIAVTLKSSLLTAEISNPIGLERVSKEPARIGMENIKRQLNLLYPGHTLEIRTEAGRFVVMLKIRLLANV